MRRGIRMVMVMVLVLATVSCVGVLAQESGKSLTQLLRTIPQKEAELKAMKQEIAKQLGSFAPKGKQAYGDFTWSCVYSGSSIYFYAKDEKKKSHIKIGVEYYDDVTEKKRKWYNKECAGRPARRFPNKWAQVLVGKVRLWVSITDKDMQSDEVIDQVVASFRLADIGKL
jgi:hypothetical protein